MGHEMTHGFDDQGRKYDSEGNMRDWWVGTGMNSRIDNIVTIFVVTVFIFTIFIYFFRFSSRFISAYSSFSVLIFYKLLTLSSRFCSNLLNISNINI